MFRKKTTGFKLMVVTLALMVALAGLSTQAGASPTAEKKLTVGYVQAGPSICWQLSAEGCVAAGKLAKIDVNVLCSEGKPDKEPTNIEHFITKKVDAILVFATNGETAQQGAKLAVQRCQDPLLSRWIGRMTHERLLD